MRLRGLVVAAIGAALLSGCGTSQAGAAAVVGTRRISEGDLQSAMSDITKLFAKNPQSTVPSQTTVLTWLVVAPYVQTITEQDNVGVSTSDAQRIFTNNGFTGTPSDPAIEAVRSVVGLNSLAGQNSPLSQQVQQQSQTALIEDLTAVKVSISPRLGGRFDPKTLQIAGPVQDWLPSPSPSAATPTPSSSQ